MEVVLVILDEIDKLEDDALLMQLSRAGEAGKLGGERDGSGVSSISDPRDV